MKTPITLLLLLSTSVFADAQNELEQARYLYQLNLKSIDEFVTNTGNNFTAEEKTEWGKVMKFVDNPITYTSARNPKPDIKIVAKILERKNTPAATESIYVGAMGDNIKNTLDGNLGAQFTSQLIIALSDLILERAKAELTLQYFTKLKNSFLVTHTVQIPKSTGVIAVSFTLKDLFPNSYNALEALLSDNSASLVSIGESFKSAFENDMKQFYQVAFNKFIRAAFNSEAYYSYIESSLFLIEELLKGSHPSLILQNLAFKNPIDAGNRFSLAVNFLYTISESLKNTTSNTVWVGQDAIDGLSAKEFLMYFSLVYMNNKILFGHLDISPSTLIAAREKYYPLVKQIGGYLNLLQSLLNEGRLAFSQTNSTKEQKSKEFFALAHSTLDLIFISKELVCRSSNSNYPNYCTDVTATHQKSAHLVIDITQAVQQKDYSSVFRKSFKLVQDLSGELNIPPALTKIGSLASDIASADSIQQIKKILDGTILPVGSFRIKRESNFSVHLNAYPGLSSGIEFLDGRNLKDNGAAHVSPFVPIGIDVSWGKDKTGKSGRQSNGLFLSVVDLGAVVSYRIQNQVATENTASQLPELKWSQLLAPGVFYVHGIRNSPLSWGLGGNLNPSLREISSAAGVKLADSNAFKLSFFIAVDIPLFNISSR